MPFSVVVPVTTPSSAEPSIYATGAQLTIYGESRAFGRAHEHWLPRISWEAGQIADEYDDMDVAPDLLQEGLARLWELDSSRFDSSDDDWIRHELRSAMRSAYRRHRSLVE